MGPFLYVMAIMGCGDGGYQCTEARLVQTHYASMQACREAAESQLIANGDLDFPEVQANCRPIGNQFAMNAAPKR